MSYRPIRGRELYTPKCGIIHGIYSIGPDFSRPSCIDDAISRVSIDRCLRQPVGKERQLTSINTASSHHMTHDEYVTKCT